jgi:hypothetical protein
MNDMSNHPAGQQFPGGHDEAGMPPDPKLFTVEYWATRDLAEPDFLLSELLTTTSRMLLIGPTGAGKTNFALATAFAIADAAPFLHWSGRRTARVLYIDGEMSARLVKNRVRQAIKRHGGMPENLTIINREDFPDLPPLNTEEGQKYIEHLVEQLDGVDLIIFDNIQALLIGSHKEDETWAPVLPWIRKLTTMKIGQLWMHHTGHATDRGYGDKTREWQFDAVALMKVPETPTPDRLLEFRLEFTKARERGPNNRADFDTVDVWLGEDDAWQSSAVRKPGKPTKPPSPKAQRFYDALIEALATPDAARRCAASGNRPSVAEDQWQEACFDMRLIDRAQPGPDKAKEEKRVRAAMSQYRSELDAANWIRCKSGFVWSIKPAST